MCLAGAATRRALHIRFPSLPHIEPSLCGAQIYIALAEAGDKLKYEVYTAKKHTYRDGEERAAVGITDGLAPEDVIATRKADREKYAEPAAAHTSSRRTTMAQLEAVCPAQSPVFCRAQALSTRAPGARPGHSAAGGRGVEA